MKTYTTDMALMNMTPEGCIEITTEKHDRFTPILSPIDRAMLSMTNLGCKELLQIEDTHPCQRKE